MLRSREQLKRPTGQDSFESEGKVRHRLESSSTITPTAIMSRLTESNNNGVNRYLSGRRRLEGGGRSRQEDGGRRSLIVGGEIVSNPNAYPYFVSFDHYCGGALIAPDIVLTAGHCAPSSSSYYQGIDLRVGTYTLYDYDDDSSDDHSNSGNGSDNVRVDTGYESYYIVKAIVHPKWQRLGDDEFRYDFAIIHLNVTDTNASSRRPYVRINRNDTYPVPTSSVTVMGMGMTDGHDPNTISNILHEVNVTVLSNDICSTKNNTNIIEGGANDGDDAPFITYNGRIKPTHLCTWGLGKDSCAYDSGSPVITKSRQQKEQHHAVDEHYGYGNDNSDLLVGLVSWGEECADPIFPGVNSRVSYVSDWIDNTICEISKYIPDDIDCTKVKNGVANTKKSSSFHGYDIDSATTKATTDYWIKLLSFGFIIGLIVRFVYNRHHRQQRAFYEQLK